MPPGASPLVSPGPIPQAAPLRAAAPETPRFFEVHGSPVYSVLHAAAPGRARDAVVVHVHGLGVEQITLYRQQVLSARAAAVIGYPVFRYHSRGHGDSAMPSADVTLDTLVADARAAADEAKRASGASRVIWLGVRMGALVAALAGGPRSGRGDAAAFVLWEPVAKPADYFRQALRTMLFSRVAGGMKPDATVDQLLARLEADGSLDVFGYTLYRTLHQSLVGASLADALAGVRVPVRLAQVQQRAKLAPAHQQLVDALTAAGGAGTGAPAAAPASAVNSAGAPAAEHVGGAGGTADVRTATIPEEPGYQLMTNPAWQCNPLTQLTTEWLDALA